LPFLLACW
jgi:hypothetical protein